MHAKIFTFTTLLIMWLGLVGFHTEISKILLTLTIAIMTYFFAIRLNLIPQKIHLNYRSILYFLWLVKEMLKSSIEVNRIIWRKNLDLKPAFAWINSGFTLKATDVTRPQENVEQELIASHSNLYQNLYANNINIASTATECQSESTEEANKVGLVVYGNSITLTPGTVTLDVNNNMLLVHALDKSSIKDLQDNNLLMIKRIKKILK